MRRYIFAKKTKNKIKKGKQSKNIKKKRNNPISPFYQASSHSDKRLIWGVLSDILLAPPHISDLTILPPLISSNHTMKLVTAQKEILTIIQEVESGESKEDKIWIAVRDSTDEDHSDYGDVKVEGSESGMQLSCEGFTITRKGPQAFLIEPPGRLCTAPSQSIDIRSVSAVALTKSTKTLLVGTEQGSLKRFDTTTRKEVAKIENAHYSNVTLLRTFPSDKVLLSVGSDFQIKIWDIELEEDKSARTFRHQNKRITDVALIGGGRNFISTSEDGSAVLWECGSGKVVSTFLRIGNHKDPALCVVVCSTDSALSASDILAGESQYECEDKVMYVGYGSGIIQEFRIASHSQTSVKFKRSKDSPVTALVSPDEHTLVAGYEDGTIVVWDRDAQRAKHEVSFNPSFPISNMTIRASNTLVFDNGPESLLTMDLNSLDVGQLIGFTEAFTVQSIAAVNKTIVVATGDEIANY
ncbi:hypothetical protein FT663_02229 [Candidozyma haemuli var. vulneris]|nr:hypothetical protein FT663_02229 [[Candida] haemuloni var. vulneris]KAF3992628.1 hypothetical protein FT662_01009 [[Candida] haemuloni var. vulneris]